MPYHASLMGEESVTDVVVMTVGQHDLGVLPKIGSPPELGLFRTRRGSCEYDVREYGERALGWLADLSRHTDPKRFAVDYELPIADKVLRHLEQRGEAVGRLVLLGTDQEDRDYRHTDTLPIAEFVEHLMRLRGHPSEVEVLGIHGDPTDHLAVFHQVHALLPTILGGAAGGAARRVVIATAGGTPAVGAVVALVFALVGAGQVDAWRMGEVEVGEVRVSRSGVVEPRGFGEVLAALGVA